MKLRFPIAILALLVLLASAALLGIASAQNSPSASVSLSPSGTVEPGTAITVTMSFSNLETDSDTATKDYVFRADVKDADNGDANACEDRAGGYGLGVDRYMWKVDEDPEVRAGATASGCPEGSYTVRASVSDANGAELASATAGFAIAAPTPTPTERNRRPAARTPVPAACPASRTRRTMIPRRRCPSPPPSRSGRARKSPPPCPSAT